jgi:hypothetical protein
LDVNPQITKINSKVYYDINLYEVQLAEDTVIKLLYLDGTHTLNQIKSNKIPAVSVEQGRSSLSQAF